MVSWVLADTVLGVALEHAAHRHDGVGLLAPAEELDDPRPRLLVDGGVAVEGDLAGLVVDQRLAEVTADQVLVGLVRPDRQTLGLGPGAGLDDDLGVGPVAEELLEEAHGAGVDRRALLEHDAVAARPHDVLAEDRAEQHLVVVFAGRPGRHGDRLMGAAVLFADDHVLGDVDQTARQVA